LGGGWNGPAPAWRSVIIDHPAGGHNVKDRAVDAPKFSLLLRSAASWPPSFKNRRMNSIRLEELLPYRWQLLHALATTRGHHPCTPLSANVS